ncbi:MAG: PD40 domain-containing protein, partial [Cyclobacteriaceae bacterium]|nr:PD40 domain-containing protein [Cyclobacteriaceae bacterium]
MYLAVDTDYPALALSPDGTVLAFVAVDHGRRSLYIRKLNDRQINLIPGTEDAVNPFFSTDGSMIGYFKRLTIMKVSTNGGSPIPVFEATPPNVHRGITWYRNDSLIFSNGINNSLLMGAAIGDVKHMFKDWKLIMDSENQYLWPCEVTGTSSVLFSEIRSEREEDAISLLSLEDGSMKKLVDGGSFPKFSRNGRLLFTRRESIFVVPFNPDTKQVTNSEQLLVDNVFSNSNKSSQFAVGGAHLAYIEKEEVSESEELVWVNRKGNIESLMSGRKFDYPRLSPDGTKLAVTSYDGLNSDIWLLEFARSTFQRLTSHTLLDFDAVWS